MKFSFFFILAFAVLAGGCGLYDTEVPDENIEIWCTKVAEDPCTDDANYVSCIDSGTQMYEYTESSYPACLSSLQSLLECLGDCEPECVDDRSYCEECEDDLSEYNACLEE